VSLRALTRVLKDYTDHVGWGWNGITRTDGEPINDEYGPKKSMILFDRESDSRVRLTRVGRRVFASHLSDDQQQALREAGYVIAEYPGGTDMNDRMLSMPSEDLELDNNGSMEPGEWNFNEAPGREPSGTFKCPLCGRLIPRWRQYQLHMRQEHGIRQDYQEQPPQDGDSAIQSPHTTPMQPSINPVARFAASDDETYVDNLAEKIMNECTEQEIPDGYSHDEVMRLFRMYALLALSKGTETTMEDVHDAWAAWQSELEPDHDSLVPFDELTKKIKEYDRPDMEAIHKHAAAAQVDIHVPFLYDVQEDDIHVGQPGQRHSDIPGRFMPGGLVEGTYEPGGRVVIRALTNMPYSVYHMIELWYYQHPELPVKSLYLMDDEGKTTKLAATTPEGVGPYISALVAANPSAYAASSALRKAGGVVYVVGGAVRDALLGKEPKDIDLMVTGLPTNTVSKTLEKVGRVNLTGKDFGVFRVRQAGAPIEDEVEIALPRRERSTGVGHKDFDVQADHTMSADEDLERRDFSANALAVDLGTGRLVDPFGGAGDIRSGTLRVLGDQSFADDPLRVLRGVVARGKHGLEPDDFTRTQMARYADRLPHLPAERIQAELDKLMGANDPASGIQLAHDTGVLKHVLPEVEDAFGYDQNNPHHERELGEHLLEVLRRTSEVTKDPDLRLAALLHDIGKPKSAWLDPETGTNHYYEKHLDDGSVLGADHETVGAQMAHNRMRDLKYPLKRIQRVQDLVQHHMWPAFTSERGARKFLHRVGPHADDLMTLRWADQGGKTVYPTDQNLSLDVQKNLVDRVRNNQQATTQSALAINGTDLIALGVPQGPQVGQILRALTEEVINDPALNNPESLKERAQALAGL
jgi:tRNA nucleotidyltransferase (CCA-adding enzyme)